MYNSGANALRAVLSGKVPKEEFTGKRLHDVMDLCLECKACKAECPSNVDMAKLKYEFLDHYHGANGLPLRNRLFGGIESLNRVGSRLAPLSNWFVNSAINRWLMEVTAGIDRRRPLPEFAHETFEQWFAKHGAEGDGSKGEVVLFHDAAEELPLAKLATTRVGPYHTNTAEGLRLSRRLLQAQRKEMKQIVMVTDGKPTACLVDDSFSPARGNKAAPARRLYKNSMGGDPFVMTETFKEVQACRKAGIMINTFMLASDYYLVDFVKQMSAMTNGKAYFANPGNLSQFVLIDFLRRRTRKVK